MSVLGHDILTAFDEGKMVEVFSNSLSLILQRKK